MLPKERKRAIVLSGGGGRGAYHVGVLKFLHEHEWFPDVIVGTSIGAVNGAALASGHTASSLWSLWKRLMTRDVQIGNNVLNMVKDQYLFDTKPLRETLTREGWVHEDRINSDDAAVHLRISATDIDTGRLHVFGNSEDVFQSSMTREAISLDHILASCSIPLVYPPTELNGRTYWDGATVSNTPLSAAIDAGAEEIIVVLMTPWEEEAHVDIPKGFIQSAGLSLDWALLASFRADMKMLKRVNSIVQLKLENARLRAIIAEMVENINRDDLSDLYKDENQDGIPDTLEDRLRMLPEPIVIAPREAISVGQIISYTEEGHQKMYSLGYEDARRAWAAAGLSVEGGHSH